MFLIEILGSLLSQSRLLTYDFHQNFVVVFFCSGHKCLSNQGFGQFQNTCAILTTSLVSLLIA